MDKQQARNLIQETFEQPFDKTCFTAFVKNLLNRIEESSFTYQGQFIPDAYKTYISVLERIGKFSDGEYKIDILIIRLKKETSLERARTMQRNFVAWYLNGSRGGELKDAALVAFVSPDASDWRFSLVRMDYKFEQTKTGRTKVKEEFTPARRWSFLVGTNENSHTAQSRLEKILADDEHDPTLTELEGAFNIETVTKEFFLKYRDLFIRTKEALDKVVNNDARIKADFDAKGVNTVDFAKKLLGQITFLYFLQKKGWFGVEREADWGSGSKQFLRELFDKKHGGYKNFFDDILEPLFYEALRIDRSHEDHYYSQFNCKIPFLNGGLFDPIGSYDWVHTDIHLPDSLFSNKNKTKEGDTGDGILDIFGRYNFTVKEDEPLEKEVAIDPELLGKAYEKFNAIRPDNFEEYKKALRSGNKGEESKFNKQYGVYYTPREIVHYMCRASLINYLHAELTQGIVAYEMLGDRNLDLFGNEGRDGQLDLYAEHGGDKRISKEAIETLIHLGEQVRENEARVESKGKETSAYSYKLPESVRKNAGLIDQELAKITVCDPAVGSGAFPVGMMSEIVRTRNVLSTFINPPVSPLAKGGIEGGSRTPYDFKRQCIEHSLYGVDIDPGAVEIAKLRLWLSLVVDEDDIKNIKPLPNLDYKIVCGDSLLGLPRADISSYDNEISKDIEEKKTQYFSATIPSEKNKLREAINVLFSQLIESIKKYDSSVANIKFDFHTHFSEVFHSSHSPLAKGGRKGGGFDCVIANPPYVRQEAIRHLKPNLSKAFGAFFCGTADIYTYFYKCGIDLLKSGGHLCFIAPNKFMRAGYGKNTRVLLTTRVTPKLVIDFGDLPIFDATTYPSILLVEKNLSSPPFEKGGSLVVPPFGKGGPEGIFLAATFTDASQLERLEETLSNIAFPMPVTALKNEGWNLEQPDVLVLMEKLRKAGKPLGEYVQGRFYRGVLTGLNEAFVVDAATREKLIAEDPASAELIKPWLRGRDIRKWKAQWAGLYLVNIPSSANRQWPWSEAKTEAEALRLFEQTYPAVYRHLLQWKKQLQKRDDQGKYWWELRSCVYYDAFEQPKIVYPNITKTNIFAFDETGILTNQKCFIIPVNDLYLLAVLNSKIAALWFRATLPLLRGGFFEPSAIFMEKFPVFPATDAQKVPIIERTCAILADPDSPAVPRLEEEINTLVYQLYDLTLAEIAVIYGSKGKQDCVRLE